MIKTIIFDFFGVIGKSTRAMMRENFDLTEQQMQELKNLSKILDHEYIGSRKFLEGYAKIVGSTYEEVYKIYLDSKSRFAHSQPVLAYILELKKAYKVALLSNVNSQATHEFIDPVRGYFDLVITSHDTQLAKPERAIYELCAQKLGVDVSECVMVDDSHNNCEGARAAGMQAIEFVSLEDLKKRISELVAS